MAENDDGISISNMNENIILESIRQLKSQQQELSQQLSEYKKVAMNLQLKVKQECSKHSHAEHIYCSMLDTLKLSQTKVDGLREDATSIQGKCDLKKSSLEEMDKQIVREREKYHSWQFQWEEECRKIAIDFKNAHDMYTSISCVETELENSRNIIVENKKELAILESNLNNRVIQKSKLESCVSHLTEESKFLSGSSFSDVFDIWDEDVEYCEMLQRELESIEKRRETLVKT